MPARTCSSNTWSTRKRTRGSFARSIASFSPRVDVVLPSTGTRIRRYILSPVPHESLRSTRKESSCVEGRSSFAGDLCFAPRRLVVLQSPLLEIAADVVDFMPGVVHCCFELTGTHR